MTIRCLCPKVCIVVDHDDDCRHRDTVHTHILAVVASEIPEKPIWRDFMRLEDAESLTKDDRHLPIGYNSENAAAYGIDLSRTYCYLVTGRARSGKTNLLKAIAASALAKGGETVVFDFMGELCP